MKKFAALRNQMVDEQIEARGVRSPQVLAAMRRVPRERFVPAGRKWLAYEDSPLPIGKGQTISQPYIVACMIEALDLEGGERVLEVGAGSGYAAAVLAEVAGEVYTVERIGELAARAAETLSELGYDSVAVRHDDGTAGWEEQAPFDAIVVAAAAPEIPDDLKRQLKVGGRLIIPVGGTREFQQLLRVTRTSEHEFHEESLVPVRFVPLVSDVAWPD